LEPVEVYAAGGAIEAQYVEGLLREEGIEARVRDFSVTPYPMHVGAMTERRIVVPPDDREAALELLRSAEADGLLTKGNILEDS
jgi:hypothetical protein